MHYEREHGCRAWLTYGNLAYDALRSVLEEFGTAEAIYDEFIKTNGKCLEGCVNESKIALLKEHAQPGAMHEMMVTMQNQQMGIIALHDMEYPDELRNISDPPPLLFYRGNLNCLMGKCIAIVGTRTPSPQAEDATRRIACDLSNAGVTVVSGLAYGIDTAAHQGCLEGRSPTVGVMACGLDVNYPTGNEKLREMIIASGGVLLSEHPPGFQVIRRLIPVRNRIISGLCKAVVMMEAKLRSGSMTTVNHAVEQGREVFAYPGNVGTEKAEAAHQLLRDGARYFTGAQDILEDMDWLDAAPIRPAHTKADLPPLTPEQRKVYQQLSLGEQSYDELAQHTGYDAQTLSSALTMLQMLELIRPLPGKTYSRI